MSVSCECGVSECDREASTMRRPWPARCCCTMGTKNVSARLHGIMPRESS